MKYAVIELSGKQYKVSEGDVFEIERQTELPKLPVLLYSDDAGVMIGTPYLDGVSVVAQILAQKLDKKILVSRFKAKSRYRKTSGHRQPISVLKIITVGTTEQINEATDEKPKPKKASSRTGQVAGTASAKRKPSIKKIKA